MEGAMCSDPGPSSAYACEDQSAPPSPAVESVVEETCDGDSDESVESEKGTKYWIPACPAELKPVVGMIFKSIDDANKWYDAYGVRCRFDVRRGSSARGKDGILSMKRFYCNREGFCKAPPTFDTSKGAANELNRRTASFRCGCRAGMVVKAHNSGGYIVSEFIERHNHKVTSVEGSMFLKHKRKLKSHHQRHILKCAAVNMGSVTAHKFAKQLAGGFNNIGPQPNDFRNWHKDVNAYIGDHDADMVISHLQKKKALYESFYFEMSVSAGRLANIFWADPVSQMQFHAFGDVVTFDATYALNKYNLIFVPFTGIDNHMKSVTFASALISSEDAHSYTWILERFIECMGRPPSVVLTDQDPALTQVVPKVMPHTQHRFCMWHIMKKLSDKVGFTTVRLQELRSKLKAVVYNYHVDPEDFEDNWEKIINEYEMADNKWLNDMFNIRHLWIPAYFRDIPLGGLLRTTSRSESANSFFGGFLNYRLSLLGFFSGFETALETQRHNQVMLDHETDYKVSARRTPLSIELHAMKTYTRRVFLDVQTEIAAGCYEMGVVVISEVPNVSIYKFEDLRYDSCTFQVSLFYFIHNCYSCVLLFILFRCTHELQVTEDRNNGTLACTCKLYERVGYLCRHVFAVLKYGRIEQIPSTYVLNRWKRNAVQVAAEAVLPQLREDCKIMKRFATTSQSDIYSEFEACVNCAMDNDEKTAYMLSKLKELRSYLEDDSQGASTRTKDDVISDFLGVKKAAVVTVMPPSIVRTKGSGKRPLSDVDIALKKAERPKRTCKTCLMQVNHDSRNCPLN